MKQFSIRQWMRLQVLKKARANIMVVGQWGVYREKKSGKKIWCPETQERASDSFTSNFIMALVSSIGGIGGSDTTDYGIQTVFSPGTNYTWVSRNTAGGWNQGLPGGLFLGTAGTYLSNGMAYSTDSSPILPTDYLLPGLIVHGSGASQLSYLKQTFSQGIHLVGGNQTMFETYRAVTNNSGATINVAKVFMVDSQPALDFEDLNPNSIINGATTGARYQFSVTT